ncbi:maleylpyruvate isomerase family mycothiol-dependent enzyme [Solicola sp. PLA-1-18]|uniref:maleylpyruvate isomerase family mycothiol-dependent enzyme n=1 Tax=Solicola sp. PLA-1-18 TaxID=3380532 RepID=UPI003B7A1079
MVARVDQATDPQVRDDLALVRLGTAYYRRVLASVSDAALDGPSLLPGWTRRHLTAHVGYNARALARLVEWAASGVENPMYPSPGARNEEIELGATLNPAALRNLSEHAAIDLDVRWRDLPADRWDVPVVTAQGRTVPVAETVWMRSREVWLHAVDLDAGGRLADVPEPVLGRLLGDVVGAWSRRGEAVGLVVETDGGRRLGDVDAASPRVVSGPLRAVVGWATGRGTLRADGVDVPAAPRWI